LAVLCRDGHQAEVESVRLVQSEFDFFRQLLVRVGRVGLAGGLRGLESFHRHIIDDLVDAGDAPAQLFKLVLKLWGLDLARERDDASGHSRGNILLP